MTLLARGQVTITTVEDGANAVSIYIRSHAAPSTPTGASPSGWNVNPDSFANSFGVLWVSDGLKDSNGNLTQEWSKPRMYEPYNPNLLWNFPWSVGDGSLSIYRENGSPNYREMHPTPFGYSDIVWKGVSNDTYDPGGGFNTYSCNIDHTKPYRMSCWFKRTSTEGSSYFGANSASSSVQVYSNGAWEERRNFYFWSGDLPELNKWYLLVGYMYGSGETKTTADSRAGIYDPTTGKKVLSFSIVSRNFPDCATNGIRVYQYYCRRENIPAYFWSPRVDLLDGREPSVEELLKKSQDGEDGRPGVDANMLDWVEDWNSSKTQIGSTSVITPMIFTGVKNSNNTITGVAMGEFPLAVKLDDGTLTTQTINGIYGFRDGNKTFSIDSYGSAELGRGTQSIKFNAGTGKIEFGSAVSMQWVGATYIDANGIFTGTLSATTISSINLSASQITSGTISADRIASGSITASKLDAASIKSSIINTDYINGLSCTFTKGTIGGWSISSGNMTCGQIALNAAAKRIAVYRSTSSSTSGHRVQFYYGSDTNFGFYATDSTGACIAQLGSANQIAGWNINTSSIYKNSVYLGSDGSIYNGTKWKLANDGSGQLANSNIKWDSSGNITFSSAVSLLWSTPISELTDSLEGNVLPKLTKITSDGVYTGTLTASQITAGTISASRIDVAAIKASLITADNINALTLTSTKGKIGGWSITSTSIAKNSVSLGSDGTISNGSKWRLSNDGSGSLAAGNISWNSAGAITFSSAVSMLWKNDIEAAKASNFGYPYYQSIVIHGEEDVYYPVIFKGGDQNIKRDILIRRGYNEQAPSSWYSSTHKGGLIALLKTNFGGWGGIGYSWEIYDLSETYCRMFAGAQHCGNSCMFAIFLRGGGTTGAKYHIYSDQAIVNDMYSPSPIPPAPQIAYDSDLMFSSGSTQVNAPAPRTLTDAVEKEIRSKRFIYLAQSSDNTLTAHPLTYIGSTGIYTGTLTANQVNAVAISASSITTGTLSADRIAAGSITASKLNAASIQADIINANYINGLTCTFTKGSIGGWNIGADNITAGSIGGDGQMPMQIRKSSTGSGYWYSGAYRPFGISMTWHKSANAGHIVIGQVASNGTSVKTGFMGIQMMSWDHQEYFCLSANYTRAGSKEVYNRIAGWGFDSQNIWKNSVYLGSDGSIYNSSNKWRLSNDGSGRVANGNITWDASGNVSFGSSVSLNWTTAINKGKLYVRGTGYNRNAYRMVILNGTTVVNTAGRGLSVTIINRSTLAYEGTTNYDTYTTETACNDLAIKLNSIGADKIVVVTSYDAIRINSTLSTALQRCGGSDFTTGADRVPYALIGIPTIGKNNGLEAICSTSSTAPYAEISTQVENGIPQGVNTNGKLLTHISGNGIYTGHLSADQIVAGKIEATFIDTDGIKARILTADSINALTLTTSKGKIGGWNITSSYIYKNSVYFGSDGSIYNSSKWRLNNDGSGQLANGNISWNSAGGITAKNALFTNVRVEGSVRNPYVLNDPSIWIGGDAPDDQENFNNFDNIIAVRGSFGEDIPLPWTLENSGRRITLINYKWNSTITTGTMDISAPSGKYFYEDGIAKTKLNMSREYVELMGYGDDKTFFGWIVVTKLNLMTSYRYGKPVRVLAQGRVTGSSSSPSITYKTFDNTTMSVSRLGTGKYKITYSSTWGLSISNAVINLTGYGYSIGSSTAPIKASVYGVYSTYMYVNASDDASNNDGSFFFQIINMNDWVY